MTAVATSALRIDARRLAQRLDALGEIGAIVGDAGERGSARLALTDEDRLGRDLVMAWMGDLGLDVSIDAIGNVVGTRAGQRDLPPVMTGSHIDTVRSGGRFDGNLGVLAGLEVIETLSMNGVVTDHPIAVAFFTGEEGARFAPDMLGSLVFVGGMAVEEALDIRAIDGARLGDELARIGYAGPMPCPASFPHAYVELHIEQGPILEAEGITIGAVTGVQGISWQQLTVVGQANHAGTTPMTMRHDAAYAAAAVTVFVRRLASEIGGHQVGTIGKIDVYPNLVNVVGGRAALTVDLRNTDDAVLQDAEHRVAQYCRELAEMEGVTITAERLARFAPVEFDPAVIDLVERTATRLGHSVRRMPSGAGHDAQMLARVCPTAMIFTPSVRGISHNPAEFTALDDLEAGANVLLQVLVELAGA
jgi:N-carbamoyl-L-amino-acid hydrolase